MLRSTALLLVLLVIGCGVGPREGDRDSDPVPSRSDGGTPDAGTPDAGSTTGGLGGFGAPCRNDLACSSGVCLSIGRCSKRCTSDGECPHNADWSCAASGSESLCQCVPQGAEVCDGRDNDCDGNVDVGASCAAGKSCEDGRCVCLKTTCGSLCVDTDTDVANCGGCGRACAQGAACVLGRCECPSGQIACGGRCVDPKVDSSNCGVCGRACSGGTSCGGGECLCPANQLLCSGRCVAAASDRNNCGACGRVCPGTSSCSAGECVCAQGELLCGGACVRPQTDPTNCGGCGRSCPSGASCTSGSCTCPAGTEACSTACVNLQTDADNCGACGRSCGGAACRLGQCEVATLVTGENDPSGLALDATSIHWTNYLGGTVRSLPKTGGTATHLTGGLNGPRGLSVEGGSFFFSTGMGIMKLSPGSGAGVLVPDYYGALVLADAANVFWVSTASGDSGLKKVSRSGGTPTRLAQLSGSWGGGLALDATDVYWRDTSAKTLLKTPKAGGTTTTLASNQDGYTGGVVLDANSVYWATARSLWSLPKAGGTPKKLATVTDEIGSLAVDAGFLYFATLPLDPNAGTVRKVALAGGTPITLASGLNRPVYLQVDDKFVYWIAHVTQQNGQIQRVAK